MNEHQDDAPPSAESHNETQALQNSLDTVNDLLDTVDPPHPDDNTVRVIDGIEYGVRTYWPRDTLFVNGRRVDGAEVLTATDGSHRYRVEVQRPRINESYEPTFDAAGNLVTYQHQARVLGATRNETANSALSTGEAALFQQIVENEGSLDERLALEALGVAVARKPQETQAELGQILSAIQLDLQQRQDNLV